jgi:hypothetical protein
MAPDAGYLEATGARFQTVSSVTPAGVRGLGEFKFVRRERRDDALLPALEVPNAKAVPVIGRACSTWRS